jgi:endonuclease/exonuclease/phosphatase family metal-dependent hydrolase
MLMQVKLLQWNILYKEKIENIEKLIKEVNPDIFCLQELCVNCVFNPAVFDTPDFIAKELGVNYYFERAHTRKDKSEWEAIGNGIFTKFPIIDRQSFFTQQPSLNPESYSDEGRVYVETKLKINSAVLTIGTTHLSYVHKFTVSDKKRKEVDNLVNGVKNNKENYILTGDLNSTPDSYTISELSKYFVNAGPSYNNPTWTTKPFNYHGFVEDQLRWRLDYVFATKDVKIVSSEIIKTAYSDHLPILLNISI